MAAVVKKSQRYDRLYNTYNYDLLLNQFYSQLIKQCVMQASLPLNNVIFGPLHFRFLQTTFLHLQLTSGLSENHLWGALVHLLKVRDCTELNGFMWHVTQSSVPIQKVVVILL